MEGYFSKNPYGVAEKNAKGRLKIEAVNLSEFKELLDTAEKEGQELSLVEIHLKTGRHHQIRVQFAGHGYPLWADARYGTAVPRQNVALSSCGLAFEHPVTGKWMEFSMEPEGMIFRKFTKKFFV